MTLAYAPSSDGKNWIQEPYWNALQIPIILNDLYSAALIAYPELKEVNKEGWFFSGSGSTFFRLR